MKRHTLFCTVTLLDDIFKHVTTKPSTKIQNLQNRKIGSIQSGPNIPQIAAASSQNATLQRQNISDTRQPNHFDTSKMTPDYIMRELSKCPTIERLNKVDISTITTFKYVNLKKASVIRSHKQTHNSAHVPEKCANPDVLLELAKYRVIRDTSELPPLNPNKKIMTVL
jgi:hypothetical protein